MGLPSFKFSWWALKVGNTYFETGCEIAVQGYPRSLISIPIESVYATSILVINSNLGTILPRFRDIAAFLLRKATLPPIPLEFLGCSPWIDCHVVAPKREDPKLIICVITS